MRSVPYVLCVGLFLSLPVAPAAVAQIGGGENCNKGIFWPFVREQGDCLTDVERSNGRTGVYQDPDAPPATEPASPATATAPANPAANPSSASSPAASVPAVASGPVLSGSSQTPIQASTAPAAAEPAPALDENNCRKGLWWPFVREAGDCLTDVERANGRQGTYQ
ncbi:MAG: hypothetical protein RJB62_25 [Pseudomonadota bacterium]|jgi:hypothetical protein